MLRLTFKSAPTRWSAALTLLLGLCSAGSALAGAITFEYRNHIVAGNDYPGGATDAGLLTPNKEFTGVGDLLVASAAGTGRCSASYIGQDMILTAAHCVTDGTGAITATAANITFTTPSGNETHAVAEVNVHPDYTGNTLDGNDVAVLKLNTTPSANVDSYGLYNAGDEVGKVFHKVGYGRSGTGTAGDVVSSGTKRDGFNRYDSDGNVVLGALGALGDLDSILFFDFDNGLVANDAFNFFFAIAGLGVDGEVNTAPGDSGGPAFIDGMIAGITSFGISLTFSGGLTSDVLNGTNSSFGEFSGDARVSDAGIYDWINAFFSFDEPISVPLPTPLLMLLLGLALLANRRRC